MIKSFTETVRFTANSLVQPGLFSKEIRAKIIMLGQTALSDVDKQKIEAEIYDSMTDTAKSALSQIGAKMPYDVIEVRVNFNDFLFVLAEAGSVRPQAPLAVAAFQGRMQRFAERLSKDEFLLEAAELQAIKTILSDDKLWNDMKFPAYIEIAGQSKETPALVGISLTAPAMAYYTRILEESVKLFGDQDGGKVQASS